MRHLVAPTGWFVRLYIAGIARQIAGSDTLAVGCGCERTLPQRQSRRLSSTAGLLSKLETVSPVAVAVLHVGHAISARLHLLVATLRVTPVPHLIVVRLAIRLVGKL